MEKTCDGELTIFLKQVYLSWAEHHDSHQHYVDMSAKWGILVDLIHLRTKSEKIARRTF